ncbi:class IV adenylate cyclase [Streptomyces albireticuli]|uniref:Adenylyl cyclase n=1 Tax=Streptomyces albireticuli TaxID=1940 RepID=A0A2A2D1E8_9ACTN|nr:class IV adenylate cyclase [Streptomyces albireticuli]MCD9146070.1 class IV adenylate cyclase [Streptomyces albireticuli]MCD9166272.1 class IV adenylate cyclase [Streptomyces albireticuli]MCD9196594.1 class IV adenylate cyclase [Streptomyces albireticuli]PAU45239.1 adenylyl cyclase [Streptomyces albireticuli]
MKNEYEAKFLNVNVSLVRAQLRELGAVQAMPRTMLSRYIYENDAVQGNQWLRLRDEGGKTTLPLKQVVDSSNIDGTTEIETEVGDLHATAELLTALGLRQVRYQQNYREEWRIGAVTFDFDTWPDLPTFLEIEGPDESSVRQAAADLGLDYAEARFGSADDIYKSELGRDILAEPTLLFTDATGR